MQSSKSADKVAAKAPFSWQKKREVIKGSWRVEEQSTSQQKICSAMLFGLNINMGNIENFTNHEAVYLHPYIYVMY